MKFYTMNWWRGVQSYDNDDPSSDYHNHLATIRNKLPMDLLALQESNALHDARILSTEYCSQSNSFEILLAVDNGNGGLRQLSVRYSDLVSFRTITDPDDSLPGPNGYGDLGYDEVDITDEGNLEHRLLFSTGIEFQIIFGGFSLDEHGT